MDNDVNYGGMKLHTLANYRRLAEQKEAKGNEKENMTHTHIYLFRVSKYDNQYHKYLPLRVKGTVVEYLRNFLGYLRELLFSFS